MGQYTAGWITVPGKGKRWRTADGEYLTQRPAGGAPGVFNAITGAWKAADKGLGGWLPGGGTPSPITRRSQELARRATVENLRDRVAIPLLDRGMAAGIVPAAPGLFARYLTGTSRPLTELPHSLHQGIRQDLRIGSKIPDYAVQDHPYGASTPTGDLSPTYFSLGRYELKNGQVEDRYDFNWLKPDGPEGYRRFGARSPQEGTDRILEDDPIARTALNFALDRGIVTPDSGYEIRAPLKGMPAPSVPVAQGQRAEGQPPAGLNPGLDRKTLERILADSEADLRLELRDNPNSSLIPRLREIRDSYSVRLKSLQ